MTFFALLREATTVGDRWLMALSALTLLAFLWSGSGVVGSEVIIHRDNQPLMTLALGRDSIVTVASRLGPVKIEIKAGRVRMLEYNSPRLIGTKTGWIQHSGEIAVCVPCGILLQVQGEAIIIGDNQGAKGLDGIAR